MGLLCHERVRAGPLGTYMEPSRGRSTWNPVPVDRLEGPLKPAHDLVGKEGGDRSPPSCVWHQ